MPKSLIFCNPKKIVGIGNGIKHEKWWAEREFFSVRIESNLDVSIWESEQFCFNIIAAMWYKYSEN